MVQADDSFRTTMHVALPADAPSNVYESSAQSSDQIEPIYHERTYFPAAERASERAGMRGFNPNVQTFAPTNVVTTTMGNADDVGQSVSPTFVDGNKKSARKPAALKAEKTANALPGTKPPRVGVNIEWVQKGVGWDCREVYYVGKKRHRRHLGHIGRQKWEDMQQQFQGTELERVLSEWIEERRAEKSLQLRNENAPE